MWLMIIRIVIRDCKNKNSKEDVTDANKNCRERTCYVVWRHIVRAYVFSFISLWDWYKFVTPKISIIREVAGLWGIILSHCICIIWHIT